MPTSVSGSIPRRSRNSTVEAHHLLEFGARCGSANDDEAIDGVVEGEDFGVVTRGCDVAEVPRRQQLTTLILGEQFEVIA